MPPPAISIIVPTRNRIAQLRAFLASAAAMTARPECVEIILVVDEDDVESLQEFRSRLAVRHVVGPPGRSMGELNQAGYEASRGEFVMLLNDDVVIRTRGWDLALLKAARTFPDGIVLVHVNDTLMREHLCTFPFVSRRFCEMAGGICPIDYRRYRIDDHIEDVFNQLAYLGMKRTIYLPDVIIEHLNAIEHPTAGRIYESDPSILAIDAPRFLVHSPFRKSLALRLMTSIHPTSDAARIEYWRTRLNAVRDPFALRVVGRQITVRAAWWKRHPGAWARAKLLARRAHTRYRLSGWRGMIGGAGRTLRRLLRRNG